MVEKFENYMFSCFCTMPACVEQSVLCIASRGNISIPLA